MKILIGTPIHECKDYCMEKWLKNVALLLKVTPADLILVDNSPGLSYTKKVKGYCRKLGLQPVIKHLQLPQEQEYHEKVAHSREVIRKYLLLHNYNAWFSWECDQIIPNNSLDELIRLMSSGNLVMANHNGWVRQLPDVANTDLGISLISKEVLKKYSFLLKFGSDPQMPHNWKFGDPWLKMQVYRDGGSFLEVFGVLQPVYHLNNGEASGEPAFWDRDE